MDSFWVKFYTIFRRKNQEKGVEIVHIIVKGRNNRVAYFIEIYQEIASVFILCELFHKSGFAYPPGTFYQKCFSACRLSLPGKQPVIHFTFKYHVIHRLSSYQYANLTHHLSPAIRTFLYHSCTSQIKCTNQEIMYYSCTTILLFRMYDKTKF